ncbi:MAG: MBL fold metallo-hydrolase [Ilumatobacteraceae bacterium]
MKVTFYGVRGSTPCDSEEVARYGGNTSCVVVDSPGEPPLLLDLGTGLRYFGRTCAMDGSFRANCLLSHLHWDHTQGLPFFAPLLCSGAQMDVYAPAPDDGRSLDDVFAGTICPPLFPVTLGDFAGTMRFHDTEPSRFRIGGYDVLAAEIPHVGRTFGYRVTLDGRSVAYLSDHQQPHDGSFSVSDEALELVEGVDLLIHDSQYTVSEFARKATWGHCTYEYALWLAGHAGVRRLAMFHHDPNRTDDQLDDIARCGSSIAAHHGYELIVAREGLTVVL